MYSRHVGKFAEFMQSIGWLTRNDYESYICLTTDISAHSGSYPAMRSSGPHYKLIQGTHWHERDKGPRLRISEDASCVVEQLNLGSLND
jgi:hypothetical protein